MGSTDMNWSQVAEDQRWSVEDAIPKEWRLHTLPPESQINVMSIPYQCGSMSPRELELTDKDATELLQLLAAGLVSSLELTLAFCKRASIAQQLVNPSKERRSQQ